MRVTHWLIGCALGIAGIGGAAAASAGTQDLENSPHAALDGAGTRDGSTGSGGDAVGLARDCPQTDSRDGSNVSSGNSNDHSGGTSSAPASTRRPHLGWQSLLPGSIQ